MFGRQNTLIQLQIALDGELGGSVAWNDQERMVTLMHSVSRLNAPPQSNGFRAAADVLDSKSAFPCHFLQIVLPKLD